MVSVWQFLTILANAWYALKELKKYNPMQTMNIALSPKLRAFVQREVKRRGYSSVSEYMRELIRGEQGRQELARLEAEIIKGIDSGPATPMTKADWQEIRREVRRRAGKGTSHS
jgi:antitoxin ParD1/3/4